ncbi:MAG: hypothetical protein H0V16_00660 [Burkholderiaceae bacterium]|nr:hypothetical protein [Burkholderiaceae bacterium]
MSTVVAGATELSLVASLIKAALADGVATLAPAGDERGPLAHPTNVHSVQVNTSMRVMARIPAVV